MPKPQFQIGKGNIEFDMKQVAAGIEKFLNDQISSGSLSDEKVESLQGSSLEIHRSVANLMFT